MFELPVISNLIEFFEARPLEYIEDEGFILFRCKNERGFVLEFSCHAIEGSMQAKVTFFEQELTIISSECVSYLEIKKDKLGEYLNVTFDIQEIKSEAKIWINPNFKVNFFSYKE